MAKLLTAARAADTQRHLLENGPQARANNGNRPRSCDSCGWVSFTEKTDRKGQLVWACANPQCGLHHGLVTVVTAKKREAIAIDPIDIDPFYEEGEDTECVRHIHTGPSSHSLWATSDCEVITPEDVDCWIAEAAEAASRGGK